jgi:release factor glutamine methyltransferase
MFRLSPETLDPRPDTETLIEAVLQAVARRGLGRSPLRVLDLGTGTGAILVTLLAELPVATGIGTDLSEGAARTAEENAVAHGVAGRARFLVADWLTGVDGAFDLVVSNPPYIRHSEIAELEPEVTRYDPGRALDGGADGLDAYRRMLGSLAGHLAPGGMLFLEVGAGQAGDVVQLIETHGLGPTHGTVETHRDLAGHDRVVAYAAHCAMRDQITVGIERSSR